MVSKVKDRLQKRLVNREYRRYEERISAQDIPYDRWIREKEKKERESLPKGKAEWKMELIPYPSCTASFRAADYGNADLLVFHDEGGVPETEELAVISAYFTQRPETVIAYVDEDETDGAGVRKNPWLKPDWSPDTLISYFYFGGLFIVRQKEAAALSWLKDEDYRLNLYDLALKAVERGKGAAHIDSVLFHRKPSCPAKPGNTTHQSSRAEWHPYCKSGAFTGIEPWGQEKKYDAIKAAAYERRGWPKKPTGLVSVIIPSKDNPGVLSDCIHSVMEASTYRDFEIIVVDNGSSEKNRARIELMREMLQEKYRFVYHYEPMVFNFSLMCNIGVSMAKGDYILLLNDDIEVQQENWLELMMEKAVLPHVGAVGAKLIYPGTEIIQHAGITNIHLGPAHKLQFRSDANEYYFLRNRLPFDVLGVTGACLLVKKSVYEEAGGFNEKLRVAFNDVEFCYHLHDLGYVNVVRNDVTLVHHESLSRGADDSAEKLRRLHQELNMLYELHPSLYNKDPYYHRYLIGDVLDAQFYPASRYDYEKRMEKAVPVRLEGGLSPEWHNEVLRIGIEFAGDMQKWTTGMAGGGDWFIQGWTFALMVDNCRYGVSLLLKPVAGPALKYGAGENQSAVSVSVSAGRSDADGGKWRQGVYQADGPSTAAMPEDRTGCVYRLSCTRQYRPDIDANLNGIVNAKMTGVCVCFGRDSLPEGEYLIGFLWEDNCSRQKLYRFSAETLVIRRD